MIARRAHRGSGYGEVYAYRTRKPGALLGLPIVGRHWGYCGQTRRPDIRDREHRFGGGRYGKLPASWSDLDPTRYVIFRMNHCPQWLLNLVELAVIRALFPVYNDRMNRANPRRVPRHVAAAHRVTRDQGGWTPRIGWDHLVILIIAIIAIMNACTQP